MGVSCECHFRVKSTFVLFFSLLLFSSPLRPLFAVLSSSFPFPAHLFPPILVRSAPRSHTACGYFFVPLECGGPAPAPGSEVFQRPDVAVDSEVSDGQAPAVGGLPAEGRGVSLILLQHLCVALQIHMQQNHS